MKEFLKELSELSRKHGYVIAGCGCCGSPHVTKEDLEIGHYEVGYGEPVLTDMEDNLTWVHRSAV